MMRSSSRAQITTNPPDANQSSTGGSSRAPPKSTPAFACGLLHQLRPHKATLIQGLQPVILNPDPRPNPAPDSLILLTDPRPNPLPQTVPHLRLLPDPSPAALVLALTLSLTLRLTLILTPTVTLTHTLYPAIYQGGQARADSDHKVHPRLPLLWLLRPLLHCPTLAAPCTDGHRCRVHSGRGACVLAGGDSAIYSTTPSTRTFSRTSVLPDPSA